MTVGNYRGHFDNHENSPGRDPEGSERSDRHSPRRRIDAFLDSDEAPEDESEHEFSQDLASSGEGGGA